MALAVVDQRAFVGLDVALQLRATCDQAPRPRFRCGVVQHAGVLGPARNPAQSLARCLMVAVPEQMPQSFHVDLSEIEWGKGRLQGTQAAHDLLDMVHAHRRDGTSRG